jgi:hypothetical protein
VLSVVNRTFQTRPVIIHAHGPLEFKPTWPKIRDAFFAQPRCQLEPTGNLTVLTCNNGHHAMGLFERSAVHLGLACMVRGAGVAPWVNSRSKPRVIYEALQEIDTEYVLYADSRDAILLQDPAVALTRFHNFECQLLFGGDRINWPALRHFRNFESKLPGATESEFRYLNGGAWLGKTVYCRDFFRSALSTAPVDEAQDSEQGILKKLFMRHYPEVRLDYRCEVFQNIGFVFDELFELVSE